jgi:hypothetical protein
MTKTMALILLLGSQDAKPFSWDLRDGLSPSECRAMLALPQDFLLATWGSEADNGAFESVMLSPTATWEIVCVTRLNT